MGEVAPVTSLDPVPRITPGERHALCCGTALKLLRQLRPDDKRVTALAARADRPG